MDDAPGEAFRRTHRSAAFSIAYATSAPRVAPLNLVVGPHRTGGATSFTRTGVMLYRTGNVLYVVRYAECVEFNRDVIGLPIVFTPAATCFAFGAGSLMA